MGLGSSQTLLPIGGRRGRPPAWPLPTSSERERELWRKLWRTPQAVMWEGCGLAVARYVRVLAEAERPGAAPPLRAEARQLEDRLGLSPMALLRMRAKIQEPEPVLELAPERVRDRLQAPDVR
jgi:hypothetical protein